MTIQDRVKVANKFILTIASHGRQFFRRGDKVGHFIVKGWRIYFVDEASGKEIYLHYKYWTFSNGGTCRAIVDDLKKYIQGDIGLPTGHVGPWPEWMCGGDLWGYGPDAMDKVRKEIQELANNQYSLAA